MKRLFLTLALINFLNLSSFAQGEGALPTLTLQRSLQLASTGQIGAAKANNDPIGYYLNPSILGYTSQNNHASFFFMPSNVEWGGSNSIWNINLNTFGFNLGYNLIKFNIPISVGFGYMHDKFSYGINEGKESYDSFDNFSFGVGFDYYILFNLGISIKPFNSKMNSYSFDSESGLTEVSTINIEGTAFDYGAMLIAPISKLFFCNSKYQISNTTYLKPLVNITIGYSLTNVGDEISYIDEAQSDPLSRTTRLGYTFDFGIDTYINNSKINLITYSFTAEAEDLLLNDKVLITENDHGGQSYYYTDDGYQSFLGDIDIGKNLIQLKADDKVVVHKGHTINLFETLKIMFGSYTGRGNGDVKETKGYGFSSEGLLKLWSYSANNSALTYIAKHFVVEYYDVNLFNDLWMETDMQGISLHMNNIEL